MVGSDSSLYLQATSLETHSVIFQKSIFCRNSSEHDAIQINICLPPCSMVELEYKASHLRERLLRGHVADMEPIPSSDIAHWPPYHARSSAAFFPCNVKVPLEHDSFLLHVPVIHVCTTHDAVFSRSCDDHIPLQFQPGPIVRRASILRKHRFVIVFLSGPMGVVCIHWTHARPPQTETVDYALGEADEAQTLVALHEPNHGTIVLGVLPILNDFLMFKREIIQIELNTSHRDAITVPHPSRAPRAVSPTEREHCRRSCPPRRGTSCRRASCWGDRRRGGRRTRCPVQRPLLPATGGHHFHLLEILRTLILRGQWRCWWERRAEIWSCMGWCGGFFEREEHDDLFRIVEVKENKLTQQNGHHVSKIWSPREDIQCQCNITRGGDGHFRFQFSPGKWVIFFSSVITTISWSNLIYHSEPSFS